MSPKQYNEKFNDLAQALGCRARIEIRLLRARTVIAKYYEVTGTTTGDRELMYPVDAAKFDRLLDSYPQLRAI